MNTVLWMLAGGVLGWIGFSVMGMNDVIGKMASVTVGAMAGIVGGKLIAPVFIAAVLSPGGFSPSALFFAIATAAAILVAVHLAQARWLR
jgi:hypothetical protein